MLSKGVFKLSRLHHWMTNGVCQVNKWMNVILFDLLKKWFILSRYYIILCKYDTKFRVANVALLLIVVPPSTSLLMIIFDAEPRQSAVSSSKWIHPPIHYHYKVSVLDHSPCKPYICMCYNQHTLIIAELIGTPWQYTVKPVYNDHLMGYLSALWSSSRWARAT